jgi:hypothetical protein
LADIKRNLEAGGGLYINKFTSGVYTERSPLFVPLSAMGVQIITKLDTLWDGGLNTELSSKMTIVRRPGNPRYCSAQFGSSDYPQGYFSFKNLSGTIKLMADTPTKVVSFTTSAQTTVFNKSTSQQSSFAKVGSILFWVDGTSAKKWNGTTVTNIGIATPVTAPTLSFSSGSLSPASAFGYQYVYVYRNSTDGTTSTASPISANTGPLTSKNITVQGASSSDGQVDKVDIYRNDDGGSLYYFLATVNNGGTWSYTDSTADTGLNDDQQAPVAHSNDPIPTGASLLKFHMGRLWTAVGNVLYFAGGPDTTNGPGTEAWPPGNNFTLTDTITALAPTTSGLVVFTAADAYIVTGTDSSSFADPYRWLPNYGAPTQNAVSQDGDLLFVYTNKGQLWELPPANSGGQMQEIGFTIRSKLAAYTPANVYIAVHRSGSDKGLFISNGSTDVWRYSVAQQEWSPLGQPVGGVNAIYSMEATTGNYKLFMGRTTGSGYILARDPTTFQDDGSSYSGTVVIGLVTAPPRQTAEVNSVLLQAMPVGTYPTLGVLLNEISGTFVPLPNPVADPPEYAGTPYQSTSLLTRRHDFKAASKPLPNRLQYIQIQITFASEAAKNEILGLALA